MPGLSDMNPQGMADDPPAEHDDADLAAGAAHTIDRGLGGGAADEPIFGCFAVMINESDWTRAPIHAASPSLVAQVYAVELSSR